MRLSSIARVLVLAALAALVLSPAFAADDLAVRITGAVQGDIQGDNPRPSLGRENTIQGFEYHHLVTVPTSGGPTTKHETIILTKPYDRATVKLWRAMDQRELLQVEFWHFRPSPSGDGTTERYYTVTLTNARVVGIEQITPNTLDATLVQWPSIERVRFEYDSMRVIWEPSGLQYQLSTAPLAQ
ncbi:MAG: type VI secretion system tube protein Hcp [Acidobacteria bacterium]|nr:type VI secretion system tube protein Hcp [Acidobacteriota bacterium]